jgi:twitching motility protein PilU
MAFHDARLSESLRCLLYDVFRDYKQAEGESMDFKGYLKHLVDQDGSDIYLSAGAPPSAKFHGSLTPLEPAPLTDEQVKRIACSIMDAGQIEEIERKPEMNLANNDSPNNLRLSINLNKDKTAETPVTLSSLSLIENFDGEASAGA